MLCRRDLLKLGAFLSTAPLSPLSLGSSESVGGLRFVSTAKFSDGRYQLTQLNQTGKIINSWELPDRGHSFAVHPSLNEFVCFARRPGDFMLVCSEGARTSQRTILSPSDRHFYGHGVYSKNGAYLYATENDFEHRRGVIGIYDTSEAYRRVGEIESGGIGPHEIVRLPHSNIIAVANGGIATHPDTGRNKLNLESMRPNLTYIDIGSGQIIEQVELGEAQRFSSIRHLSCNSRGQVVLVCQTQQGAPSNALLIASQKLGQKLIEYPLSPEIQQQCQGYFGSVCFDHTGDYFCATSPRGGLALIFDSKSRETIATYEINDVCGCAPSRIGGSFIVSNGQGELSEITVQGHQKDLVSHSPIQWDNHIMATSTLNRGQV